MYVMYYIIFHGSLIGIQPTGRPTAAHGLRRAFSKKWPLLGQDSIGRILAIHTGEVFIFMSAKGGSIR